MSPPSTPPPSRSSLPTSRGGRVAIAVAVAAALAGFFTGTRELRAPRSPAAPPASPGFPGRVPAGASAQPGYGDMRRGDFRGNSNLYANAAEVLGAGLPDPLAPVELSDEERARAVETRHQRRAYDGAPPTIPHAVGQLEPTGCLVCHERGANVAGRIASPISHARYASCLQCHVAGDAPGPQGAVDGGTDNAFVGNAWGKGTRAWPGAPPTTPHPTWMRNECTSCHGAAGKLGLRSSHPWRASCEQCHAPSATLDQRPPGPVANAGASP